MSLLVYHGANALCRYVLLPPYGSVSVRGLENVPLQGPLLIASNHLNDADPGIIASRLPRRIVFVAKQELFRIPLLKQFLEAYRTIPVRRYEADLSVLREIKRTLDEGLAVCIFPEGTREGADAKLKEAYPGAGLIALRERVPVLPIALTGSGRLDLPLMFVRLHRRYRITLTIGRPFTLPSPERIDAAAARDATRTIMERIAALLPPQNRGYYGYVDAGEAATPQTGGTG